MGAELRHIDDDRVIFFVDRNDPVIGDLADRVERLVDEKKDAQSRLGHVNALRARLEVQCRDERSMRLDLEEAVERFLSASSADRDDALRELRRIAGMREIVDF